MGNDSSGWPEVSAPAGQPNGRGADAQRRRLRAEIARLRQSTRGDAAGDPTTDDQSAAEADMLRVLEALEQDAGEFLRRTIADNDSA